MAHQILFFHILMSVEEKPHLIGKDLEFSQKNDHINQTYLKQFYLFICFNYSQYFN